MTFDLFKTKINANKGVLPLALLIIIAMARLIHLDADPGLVKSLMNNASDVGDEAYWSAAARNMFLFGTPAKDDYFQGATSPFYSIMVYISYWFFDVSMFTSRLPNAILGIIAVILAYRLFEPYNKQAAFLAGLTLALENNFFIHTRMGQVEAACGVFALLSFYLLIRSKAPILAGVSLGLSIATKIVALLLVPAFVLFFLFQWIRRITKPKEIIKFCVGFSVIGMAMIAFVITFRGDMETAKNRTLLKNPTQVVLDFVTGYKLLNPTHYEGDIVLKNAVMQSQGIAIMRKPVRVLIDFIVSYYLSYPTIVLLVLILGGYAWRVQLAMWVGKGARERLMRVTDIEIMVISWLVGFAISMLFLSDVPHRRMNLFTIPLTLIPGLLMLHQRDETDEPPRGVQIILLCIPIIYAGTLVGRKALQILLGISTGWGLLIAGSLMILGTTITVLVASKKSPLWWKYVKWITLISWIILASLSLTYFLPERILPNMGITSPVAQRAVIFWFLTAILVFGMLARKGSLIVVIFTLLISATLDVYDVTAPSFSARDSSRLMTTLTTQGEWVIGDGAHVLSLNALYYPVQAYPGRGINRDFVTKFKPRLLFREVDHRDHQLNNPNYTEFSVKEDDFYAIGASQVQPIADFPLYPVLHQPAEIIYRLYRVTY